MTDLKVAYFARRHRRTCPPNQLYRVFGPRLALLLTSAAVMGALPVSVRADDPAAVPISAPASGTTVNTAPAAPSVPTSPAADSPSVTTSASVPVPVWQDPLSGVAIYAAVTDETFPPSWRGAPISAAAKPPTAEDSERALRVLQVALRKYPVALLKGTLQRIYIVGDLEFDGIHAAGTNSATNVYIKIDSRNRLYTDTFVEETFHHEFAHMLRRNFANYWDDACWVSCNPAGFQYGQTEGGVGAIKAGKTSLWPVDEWNRLGFFSEYAASDISEDFATVGGALFEGDAQTWPAVDRFPALSAKVKAGIAFYTHIDPSLTEAYFRTLKAVVAPDIRPVAPVPTETVLTPSTTPVAPSAAPAKSPAGE